MKGESLSHFLSLNKESIHPDSHGRVWNGEEWKNTHDRCIELFEAGKNAFDTQTPYQRKMAFKLNENVKHLFEIVPLERLGFLTITFRENLTNPKEANRRFNILNTNCLRKHFGKWICVTEFQKRGAAHFHLLVELPGDIRTGFDFAAYDTSKRLWDRKKGRSPSKQSIPCQEAHRAYTASASPLLKEYWSILRKAGKSYNFGRISLEPIKKHGEAVGNYMAKYIAKGCAKKPPSWKGFRLVRESRGWAKLKGQIAWNNENSREWRRKVGETAQLLRVTEETISEVYGKRWAYYLRRMIEANPEATPEMLAAELAAQKLFG